MTSPPRDPETAVPRASPLFQALVEAFRNNHDGVITVFHAGVDTNIPITLRQGRVVSVAHERTSIQQVASVLTRVGILSSRDLARAQREASKREVYLEDCLVERGLVSKATIAATREKAAVDLLMDLLLRKDLKVTTLWSVVRGVREAFALPIPYLLKEAQRRASLQPLIRRTVSGPDCVFMRACDVRGSGAPVRLEDFQLSAAERQVYFFTDGRRTVADLMLATSQSEFEVAHAIHNLVEMKLIVPVTRATPENAIAHAARSSIRRLVGLTVAIVALLAAIHLVFDMALGRKPFEPWAGQSPFHSLLQEAPVRRIEGAVRIADLCEDVDHRSFEDLVRARLALPEDRRAALIMRLGDKTTDTGEGGQ